MVTVKPNTLIYTKEYKKNKFRKKSWIVIDFKKKNVKKKMIEKKLDLDQKINSEKCNKKWSKKEKLIQQKFKKRLEIKHKRK